MRRIILGASAAAALTAGLAAGQTAPESGSICGRINHPLLGRRPAAVYVEKVPGRIFAPPADHAVVDQVKWVFIPHVVAALKGPTAATDREGRFAINDVPPGSYRLTFWHEPLESEPRQVVVEEGKIAAVAWLDPKRK